MKKTLLTAGIILAACLPSFISEASNNIILPPLSKQLLSKRQQLYEHNPGHGR